MKKEYIIAGIIAVLTVFLVNCCIDVTSWRNQRSNEELETFAMQQSSKPLYQS